MEIYHIITEGSGFRENLSVGYRLLRVLGVYIFCFKSDEGEALSNGKVDCVFLSSLLGKTSLLDLENGHADINDLLVAIFSSETTVQADEFEATYEGNRDVWEGEIRSLFQHGGFPPDRGSRVKIVTDTIHSLTLTA